MSDAATTITLEQQLLDASAAGGEANLKLVGELLSNRELEYAHRHAETGVTALMNAASRGDKDMVYVLTSAGVPWNLQDAHSKTAGEYAVENGHADVFAQLVDFGVRVELLLSMMGRTSSYSKGNETKAKAVNEDYLTAKLEYTDDGEKLLDDDANGVMMSWETELMREHARFMFEGSPANVAKQAAALAATEAPPADCGAGGLDVLNVGFGMGIIDTFLQELQPRTHTIVEAHPDVIARMHNLGWHKKPGVRIIHARWQDAIPQLVERQVSSAQNRTGM
jgi:protein arginine N-methyltransferase 2